MQRTADLGITKGGRFGIGKGAQFAGAAAIWGGLNIRPTPRVVLKMQITKSFFVDQLEFKWQGVFISDFQVAWSF